MRLSGRQKSFGRACVALLSLGLGGCIEQAAQMGPEAGARPALVKREGVTLSEATVALVSVEGAPAAVAEKFAAAWSEAAKGQEIALVETGAAHYLVRGYLSANATESGAEIEYVWDVFGPDRHREIRLNDVIAVKETGADPWALLTPAALQSVAAKSASDLAAFLSRSPEAKPIAQAEAPKAAGALSYASAD